MKLNVQTVREHLTSLADLAGFQIATDKIDISIHKAPHEPPSRLPSGKMAVYVFIHNGKCLKVGKAGSNSNARYTSQHYSPGSSKSNFAKSIIESPSTVGLGSIDSATVGEWIKRNTDRMNILFDVDLGIPFLTLAEAFVQCWLRPAFEGFESQR